MGADTGPEILQKTRHATYGTTFPVARRNYSQLRTVLVSNSKLEGKIPRFIIDNPTLDDFYKFIKKERSNGEERRLFLLGAFSITRNIVHGKENPSNSGVINQIKPSNLIQSEENPSRLEKLGDNMNQQVRDSVFIVHGRDNEIKEIAARFLEKLELNPIILHEKANMGLTIMEKFEAHSAEARFAVILLTPDDVGKLASETEASLKPRARQNVIFEMGYFCGRLGREKVCALYSKVEQPSDLDGILYIPVDDADAWKTSLAKELKAAGIKANYAKIIE
jgi:predicted nucleotide-binding protein